AVHDQFTDLAGGALALRRINYVLLHLIDNLLHFSHGDWALFAGAQHSSQYFLALELLPPAALFHHHIRNLVDSFIGGEALFALQALAATANGFALFALARVHYF